MFDDVKDVKKFFVLKGFVNGIQGEMGMFSGGGGPEDRMEDGWYAIVGAEADPFQRTPEDSVEDLDYALHMHQLSMIEEEVKNAVGELVDRIAREYPDGTQFKDLKSHVRDLVKESLNEL